MTIEIDDPGFKNGRRDPQSARYDIKISQDGKVVHVIVVNPTIYPKVILTYLALNLLLSTGAFLWGDVGTSFSTGNAILGLQLLHFILSFTFVKENEMGGLVCYGRPVKEIGSGIVFMPLAFLQLIRLPQNPIQAQFPGNPELVYKGSDEQFFALPQAQREKFLLPIRATTGSPSQDTTVKERTILETQMTLEINFYVRWRIEHFWIFAIRIGSVEEATRQFRDSGERATIEEVSSRTPAKVIAELTNINRTLHSKLEDLTEDWGVNIVEAAMLSPDITHTVNKAMQAIIVKKAEGAQTVVTAQATRIKLTEEGEGNAAARGAELKALAQGTKDLGVNGRDILDLEKARALANGDTTIFVDGGKGGDILGLGARFMSGGTVARDKRDDRRDRGDRRNEDNRGQETPQKRS